VGGGVVGPWWLWWGIVVWGETLFLVFPFFWSLLLWSWSSRRGGGVAGRAGGVGAGVGGVAWGGGGGGLWWACVRGVWGGVWGSS